jgi:ABC-type transport system substrate-binding protein
MKMRLVLVVIGLLVAGAVVVGCGSDNNSSDNTSASTPSTDTGGGSGGDTSTTDTGGGSGGSSNPQVQQAVQACKQQIAAQPGIDASVKADLTKICEKAATGDQQAVRDATKQVCTKLVEANVPSGSARDQALQACNQAGGTP